MPIRIVKFARYQTDYAGFLPSHPDSNDLTRLLADDFASFLPFNCPRTMWANISLPGPSQPGQKRDETTKRSTGEEEEMGKKLELKLLEELNSRLTDATKKDTGADRSIEILILVRVYTCVSRAVNVNVK